MSSSKKKRTSAAKNGKAATAKQKPGKPYAGYPLFPHPSGQWAKKIRGRLHYFGVWRDPQAALDRLNREMPYLREGRTPPAVDVSNGCSLRTLCNAFLQAKEEQVAAGELSPRSFRDYFKTCEVLINQFGKDRMVSDLRPEDFRALRAALAKRLSVVGLRNAITRCATVFNYAHENELIPAPVKYGSHFDRPSAKTIRRHRNASGPKLFTAEEVNDLLDHADVQLKAMILLGVNCGFGNTDVANLPQTAVDWETGWIDFPRPKTEIQRRVPLWPQTLETLKEALSFKPAPRDREGRGLVFLTRQGRPWVRMRDKVNLKEGESPSLVPIDALSQAFAKLMRKAGVNARPGIGFYTLRHCFETIAGESKDQVAVDAIMGHVDSSMSANYRHKISDERLQDVVETVRAWLFDESPGEKGANQAVELADGGQAKEGGTQ
jgi:integrase